jgi:predicted metal-dependent hydrolase
MLMKLPPTVIAYVVVHELAHIRHKHHQRDFWNLVKRYMPDYQLQIKELHTYTT